MIELERIRREIGWTRPVLAYKAGVTSDFIYMLERGLREGRLAVWDKLEELLGVPQKVLRAPAMEDAPMERVPVIAWRMLREKENS